MKYYIFFLLILSSGLVTAQEYKLEGNEVRIDKPILFETGTATLKVESSLALAIIKKYLDDKSYISLLRIECHTDNTADNDASQSLSEKRALAISKELVKMGVDCKRLIVVGFGSTKPVADNNTPGGKAANRRVSFINAALRGHVIGGLPVDGGGKVAGDSCN